MPDYRARARRAATRYGLDPHIFERQIGAESGFDPTARSGAGAQGIAQIMPATARGWGVDPLDPDAALNAAAKNMAAYVKKYGGYENALRAYNAGPAAIEASRGYKETNAYVAKILGGRDPGDLNAPQDDPAPAASKAAKAAGPVASALATITLPQRQRPTVTGPQAARTSETFYRTPETAGAPQRERFEPGAVLEAIRALQPQASDAGAPSSGSGSPASGGSSSSSSGTGAFKIEGPKPERLQPSLTKFAAKVADTFGGTLTGKDGSSHSKLTVNGNVSQHYTGNATDIFTINGKPATGKRLLQAGRAALIAAGMPRAQARKAPGGLYNVGGHQIIFGVDGVQYGGDHTDHLHISAR